MKQNKITAMICVMLIICTFAMGWITAGADDAGLKSDIDNNGTVDILDVILLLKKVTETSVSTSLTVDSDMTNDVDGNGALDILDVILLLKQITTVESTAAPTSSEPFTEGNGTEDEPYVIYTAEELYKLAELVNTKAMNDKGEQYATKAYKLGADITLNDETFEFLPDTGLVMVTDGTNVGYVGTGVLGDESGENTVFDETASKPGEWYASQEATTEGEYSGTLNVWDSVGNSETFFNGKFDGTQYTIRGIYINTDENYQGLFGRAEIAEISNIKIESSLTIANNYVGAVVGYCISASVSNCENSGIVVGRMEVGGIIGNGFSKNRLSGDINSGTVIGYHRVGGVIGHCAHSSEIDDCQNYGDLFGTIESIAIGGVVGELYSSALSNSKNSGTIKGTYSVGGVVGMADRITISRCINSGDVFGVGNFSAGIVASLSYTSVVTECFNVGKISGNEYVGGIIGYCSRSSAENNYNSADVSGKTYVGGVVGFCVGNETIKSSISSCYTMGNIKVNDIAMDCAIGIVSDQIENAEISCVYLIDTEAENDTDYGGTLLTDEQMRHQESFVGFDFDEVWILDSDTEYPYPELITE